MTITWEKLQEGTMRLKVPGGWLINVYTDNGESLCFLPDPMHNWGAE